MKKINKERFLDNLQRLMFQDSATKLFAAVTDTQDPTAQAGGFDFSNTHILENNMLSGDYCRVLVKHAQDSPHFRAGLYLAAAIVSMREGGDELENEPLQNASDLMLSLATKTRDEAPSDDVEPSQFDLTPHLAGMQSYIIHKISATSILLDVLAAKGYQPQATHEDLDLADMCTTKGIAYMIEPILGRMPLEELAATLSLAKFTMQEDNNGDVYWNLWPTDELFPTNN